MKIEIRDDTDDPLPAAVDVAELEKLAGTALAAEGVDSAAEVAITLIGAPTMAALNGRYLGKAGPTDVLSFPLEELTPGVAPHAGQPGPPAAIGDVFICPQVVADNAAAAGVPLQDEMALIVVHGLLHLLGYDHVADAEAEQMEQRERDLLAVVGRTRP